MNSKHIELSLPPLSEIEEEIDRRECEYLSEFVKRAWHHVDPQPYIHGWHMDALSEHLEACANGDIKRLLINIPPGTSKSSVTGVFFPAWLWGPRGWPSARYIGASYEQGLATRDSRKTRMLVDSEWYKDRWNISLTGDQNEKTFFENTDKGFRQACAVKSMTGKRGDFVVWDDPLSPEKAYSHTERETANRVFAETLPSRLIDPQKSVIIIIMQRLHEDDVSGYILSRDLGYDHLMLPMEFETNRKCITSIGWEDPRKQDGELLFEDRFPREIVDRDKKVMGSFSVAGQFQQRPVPREGGMFKKAWFDGKIIDDVPAGTVWVRHWDLAATKDKNAARTAGVKMGRAPDGSFIVANVVKTQDEGNAVKKLIRSTAEIDGIDVKIGLPQDPGQAGKTQAKDFANLLAGWTVKIAPETGSKETRASPYAAQCEAGNVYLLRGDWIPDYIDELTLFPGGKWKDQVDASSGAFGQLIMGKQKIPQLSLGSVKAVSSEDAVFGGGGRGGGLF